MVFPRRVWYSADRRTKEFARKDAVGYERTDKPWLYRPGARGGGLLEFLLLPMEDVDIPAVCDLYEDRREKAAAQGDRGAGHPLHRLCRLPGSAGPPGLDGVIIATSWQDHVPIAIAAMRRGLYTAFEVGGAYSLDQCWQLVHTQEETGVPCMMLENCCYGRDEMMALHMARLGVFGRTGALSGGV